MEQITITPNYEHMLRVMLRGAKDAAEPRSILYHLIATTPEDKVEILRTVQGILAPLNVAAQCMTTPEAVEQFRETLSGIVTALDSYRVNLENPTDPTDGKGIL